MRTLGTRIFLAWGLLALWLGNSVCVHAQTPRLKVSAIQRFLVTENGQPFFWLGDTAWELFHRLNREEAVHYLDTRAKQGFNLVQAVAIAELDGHKVPNAYGHLPFTDLDVTKPAENPGADNDYWDHVDFIVRQANQRGIQVGFLPTWGRYWHDTKPGEKPLFTPENAGRYGEWLGRRYKDSGIVWILGGDRPVENDGQREIIRAMAKGLRRGDGGSHLMTFHPPGGNGSSTWFHGEDWLDFNMRQNGHSPDFTGRYDNTRKDYDRSPVKPVLDGEPIYEDHPVSFDAKRQGHSIASDVRRALYWDLFGGACGHTYGHHSVWQMWTEKRPPVNNPLLPWKEALLQPGAEQMRHGKALMESRPYLDRVPDQELLVEGKVPTAMPGAGRYRFIATRAADGSYGMVYAPVGRPFVVNLTRISGKTVRAWWFNPRDGNATPIIGEVPRSEKRQFTPPNPGEMLDWVLVLDDAARDFPPPGQKKKE